MSGSISDHLARRQAEAGAVLAACASVEPAATMRAMAGLQPALILDLDARRFLQTLACRRGELDQADSDQQIELAVGIAWELGIQLRLNRWFTRMCDHGIQRDMTSKALAVELVKEIKRLAITRTEVDSLLAELSRESVYAS